MRTRSIVSVATIVSFMLVTSAPPVWAEGSTDRVHVLSQADLHVAVKASQDRADQARASVRAVLSQPAVQSEFARRGISADRLMARVAGLDDAEVQRLGQQIMRADLAATPAGLSTGAIIAIVAGAVGGTVLLIWLLNEAAEDDPYYWYY